MTLNNRIIFLDNVTIKDLSVGLNNFKSGISPLPIVAAEDKLFIGGDLAFNHRYFHIGTGNTAAAKISAIHLWDGNDWEPAVDIIDQTLDPTGLITMSKSGHVTWTLDKDETWRRDDTRDTNNDSEDIPGLGDNGVIIYDLYWARFTFGGDLDVGTTLKFLGHKFHEEEDLQVDYPELVLSNTKIQFEAGKTDWLDQEFKAAQEIIRDLKSSKVIMTPDQILNWELFRMASVHKIAELIYRAFGDDYEDNRKVARDYYKEALKVEVANIDKNANARLDPKERLEGQGFLIR